MDGTWLKRGVPDGFARGDPWALPIWVLFLVGCILLRTLGPSRAIAFDSYGSNRVHDEITAAAARCIGLPGADIPVLQEAVRAPDYDETKVSPDRWPPVAPNAQYRPEHHFDRRPGIPSSDIAKVGKQYIRKCQQEAQGLLAEERPRDAEAAVGRGLHALQDFFAHSNFCDLSEDEKQVALDFLLGDGRVPPERLRFTAYDLHARDPGRPPGDDYGHDEHAKDNPHKNADAETTLPLRTIKSLIDEKMRVWEAYSRSSDEAEKTALKARLDALGREINGLETGQAHPATKFEVARSAAQDASCRYLERVRDALGKERWDSLWNRGAGEPHVPPGQPGQLRR